MNQVICGRTSSCGFRVHARYFFEKPRFDRSQCPRCGGPLLVVSQGTDNAVAGAGVDYETGIVATSQPS